jgi:uncharacterized protein (TIGR02145 family)
VSNACVHAESTYSDLNLSINSVIALTLTNCDSSNPESIVLNIDPTANGAFKSTCQNINVVTNTPGYSLSVKAGNVTDGNSLLYQNPTTLSPKPTIPATSTGSFASPQVLPNDTWGYAIEKQTGMTNINFDTTYTANNASNKYANLSITDQQLYETDEFPAPITDFGAYYASKLTLNTTAGTYKTTITYTAIGAEIPPIPEIACVQGSRLKGNIGTMQSGNFPALTAVGDTGIATDARDNQKYCIGLLADGNIWQLDNLKLELGVVNANATLDTTILEPANSNVTSDTVVDFDWSNFNYYNSAHDGNFVTDGYLTRSGNSITTPPNLDVWRQVDPSGAANCLNNTGNGANGETYNPASKTGCGYLYNFYTATAGTVPQSVTTVGTIASGSICPTNWKLPSTVYYDSGYKLDNDFPFLSAKMDDPTATTGTLSGNGQNWQPTGPFRGAFSGYWISYPSDYGNRGQYWSSTVYNGNSAYYIGLTSTGASMYNNYYRFWGQAVRCLVGT